MVNLTTIARTDYQGLGYKTKKLFLEGMRKLGIAGGMIKGRGKPSVELLKKMVRGKRKVLRLKRKRMKQRKRRGMVSIGDIEYRLKEFDSINNFNAYRVFSNASTEADMYSIIQNVMINKDDIPFVTLFFTDKITGELRPNGATINSDNLISLEDFLNRIEELRAGTATEGSGPISADEWDLVIDRFDLIFVREVRGYGFSDSMLFDVVGIDSKKSRDCFEQCFKKLCPKLWEQDPEFQEDINKMDPSVNNGLKIIKKYGLNINIVWNTFSLREKFFKLFQDKKDGMEKVYINKRRCNIFKLDLEDINLSILGCDDDDDDELDEKKDYIIYDAENKHFDIVKGKINIKNVYMDISKNVYKKLEEGKYKKIFSVTQLYKTNVKAGITEKTTNTTEYLIIDYETVTDWEKQNIMIPYSLSCFHATNELLEELNGHDERYYKLKQEIEDEVNENKEIKYKVRQEIIKEKLEISEDVKELKGKIKKIIDQNCKFYLSYDCTKQLLEYIRDNQKNKRFVITTFNGSNFDNFILLKDILSMRSNMDDMLKMKSEIVTNIFFKETQLFNFKINGRHDLFDIRSHLSGSLKNNCKDFN
ncbi:hypothetical protein, partial [Lutibacter sp.]|uniref:hypothetical protein n=1 Tax=Lutibacter sp. TaxID=1925666 RepID=UPI0034A0405C